MTPPMLRAPSPLRLPRLALSAAAFATLLACSGGPPRAGAGAGGPAGGARGTRNEPADVLVKNAEGAYRDGDYESAQALYEEALASSADDPRIVANLANCYLKNRLVKKAEDLLTGHLSRFPEDGAARLVLARVHIRQGEFATAAEALRAVVKRQPDSLVARYNLGFVAYRLARYPEAEANLERTIALKPDHPEAHYTLGLTHLAQARYPEAIAELERAVAINPRHVGAHFNLANAFARSGKMKEARSEQAVYAELSGRIKATTEREVQIGAVSVKAVRYKLDRKYPEALAEYQSLAARYPDYAPLYNEIGRLELRLDRREEAFEALKKAVALDPKQSEPHYLLSGLYRERGEAQAAEREMSIFATLETIPEGKSGY